MHSILLKSNGVVFHTMLQSEDLLKLTPTFDISSFLERA